MVVSGAYEHWVQWRGQGQAAGRALGQPSCRLGGIDLAQPAPRGGGPIGLARGWEREPIISARSQRRGWGPTGLARSQRRERGLIGLARPGKEGQPGTKREEQAALLSPPR